MTKKKNITILILILLLGISVRLYQVKDKIFFVTDDWYTFKNCSMSIPALTQYWFSEGHFPMYFIMTHYWMKISGNTEFAVRLPSLFFGVLTIYAMFILGRRLFTEKTGLLAGFLLAMSSVSICFSQIAKPYSMAEFFVLMSFLFLYDALEKNTMLRWAGYMVFTLCALLLNVSTLPIIICQMLFIRLLWVKYKKTIGFKKVTSVFFVIFLFYTPFLLKLIAASFKDGKIMPLHWVALPSLKTAVGMFSLFGGRISMFKGAVSQRPSALADIFGIILFALCLKGVFSLFKSNEREDHAKAIYLSIWFVGPISLFFIFSWLVSPVFGPVRYLLYISVAYYLLIAKGIESLKKRARFLMLIFILIFSFASLRQYHYVLYHEYNTSSWKRIQFYIEKNSRLSDKIVLSFHNTPGKFDVLFRNINSLPLGLSILGVWSSELSAKASNEDMAVKIVTGKGIPKDKEQKIKRMLEIISVSELKDLKCEKFWFIDWNTGTDLKMADLFKNKYSLIEEKKFYDENDFDINVYYFKQRE